MAQSQTFEVAAPSQIAAVNARWTQLLLGFIVMMTISSPQYVWTLFVPSFQKTTGSILSEVQWTITILIVLQTWLAPMQGFLVERFSPKLLIGLGALMSGAGWIASSYTQTIWGLYATYGFLCGVGTGIVYIGIFGLMVKWFPDRRGLATGVVAAGYGFVYSEGERSNASPIRIYQRLGRNEKGRRSAAMRSKTILLLRLPGTENSEEARKFKTPTPDAFAASIADGISSGPATLITIKSTPRERAALLQRLQMIRRNGIGIRHCRYPPRSWYSLNQNFLTFAVQFRRQQTDTRDVAAGLGERSNQSLCNHVFGHADQRYGVSNVLECTQGKRRTGDDRVWRGFDQRCRKFAGMLGVGFEAIRNHDEILTFGEPVAAQFVEK